jgi:glycosyltransferase involved in cell wall biosynthesis
MNHGELEDRLRAQGITVTVFDESRLSSPTILKGMIKLLKETRPDVIHTHRLKENVLGSIAAMLAGRIPSIRTVHGAPEHSFGALQFHKRALRLFDRLTGRYLQDRIIAVSGDLAGLLRQLYPPSSVYVIENGIEVTAQDTERTESPCPHDPKDQNLKIGIAGRLVPVKRMDTFIQAARYLKDHYHNIQATFEIYGDGPLKSDLESLGNKLDTGSYVCFRGHVEDMPTTLRQLDLLVLTSDHEGLPMILLEAMATRVPIIAHAVGGIPELLDHGNCGILITSEDPTDYAEAIQQLAHSPDRRAVIATKALERVRQKYSATGSAKAYLDHYHAISIAG